MKRLFKCDGWCSFIQSASSNYAHLARIRTENAPMCTYCKKQFTRLKIDQNFFLLNIGSEDRDKLNDFKLLSSNVRKDILEES